MKTIIKLSSLALTTLLLTPLALANGAAYKKSTCNGRTVYASSASHYAPVIRSSKRSGMRLVVVGRDRQTGRAIYAYRPVKGTSHRRGSNHCGR